MSQRYIYRSMNTWDEKNYIEQKTNCLNNSDNAPSGSTNEIRSASTMNAWNDTGSLNQMHKLCYNGETGEYVGENQSHVVYLWTETNRPVYVGVSTGNIHARCKRHLFGKEFYLFQRKLRKHRPEFRCYVIDTIQEKLSIIESFDKLLSMEKKYILEFDTKYPSGYNLTNGGTGMVGLTFTEEHRKKISKALTGKKCSNKTKERLRKYATGRVHSEKTRRNMSLAQTGKLRSNETKAKLSIALTGRVFSEETRLKMSIAHIGQSPSNKGKSPSEKTRLLWSAQRKGRKPSEETKIKMSLACRGEKHHFYGKTHKEESKLKISQNKPLGISGIRGVRQILKNGKITYIAQQRYNKTMKYLGSFKKIEDAENAVVEFRKNNNLYGY